MQRAVEAVRAKVAQMERDLAHFPARFAGGAAAGALPAGGRKFQVLMKLDDLGTVGWEWPRFHQPG